MERGENNNNNITSIHTVNDLNNNKQNWVQRHGDSRMACRWGSSWLYNLSFKQTHTHPHTQCWDTVSVTNSSSVQSSNLCPRLCQTWLLLFLILSPWPQRSHHSLFIFPHSTHTTFASVNQTHFLQEHKPRGQKYPQHSIHISDFTWNKVPTSFPLKSLIPNSSSSHLIFFIDALFEFPSVVKWYFSFH